MARSTRRTSKGASRRAVHRRRHARHSPLIAANVERVPAVTAEPASNAFPVRTDGARAPLAAAVLIGCFLALVIAGLARGPAPIASRPPTYVEVALAALAALGAGLYVPRRMAGSMARIPTRGWRLMERTPMGPDGASLPAGVDGTFQQAAVAILALTVGVLAACIPGSIRLAESAREMLFAHFVWSWPGLIVLEALLVFGVLLIPLFACGCLCTVLYRGALGGRATALIVSAAALAGAFLGSLLAGLVLDSATVLAAVPLPPLIIALAAGWRLTNLR